MSGETEHQVSAWTVDSLKEYLERYFERILNEMDRRYAERFNAQEKAVRAALESAEKAVTKAEDAATRRFESVNEFRATLSDQAGTFISRKEVETMLAGLTEKVDDTKARQDKVEGRSSGLNAGWAALVGAGALIASVIAIVVAIAR